MGARQRAVDVDLRGPHNCLNDLPGRSPDITWHRTSDVPGSGDPVSKSAGPRFQEPAGERGAPPGTRTPNPRIKSPNPVISFGFGLCQLVSSPQVSDESPCRRVPSSAAPVHGHRALMEHRDRQSVLHQRTRWGSVATAEAAEFGSAGSVVTVTWSAAPGAAGSVGAGRGGSHSRSRGATHRWRRATNAIESRGRRAGPAAVRRR